MTPKQIERLQKKINTIRRTLTAEKRKFGWFDDSRGLRYLPTKYFIQLGDYDGGLKYLRWFDKNFPDDSGFPDFLFEWTIILFKTGNTKDAEKKAYQTFFRNTYLFDKFFGRTILRVDKWEGSNLETPEYTDYFNYNSDQPDLKDFSDWLQTFTSTPEFFERTAKYIDIYKRLKTEEDRETRGYLINQARQLEEDK